MRKDEGESFEMVWSYLEENY